MIFCMVSTQSQKKREGKRKKKKEKKKLFSTKPRRTTIHTSSREVEDAEMNQMMWWKRHYNHRCQPHAMTCDLHTPAAFLFFLFLFVQNQKYLQDQSAITNKS